jgi:hypothetical protein
MVNHGMKQHQDTIVSYLVELESLGFHTVNCHGKAPDAIAVKDNKIYAVEIMGFSSIPKKGWEQLPSIKAKKDNYDSFDGILFKIFKKDKIILSEPEKHAKKIVDNFIKEIKEEKEK